MSRRNKLEKFAELTEFNNVLEYSEKGPESGMLFNGEVELCLKNNWRKDFFNNANPIVLELACGRGEYTNALAEMSPIKNFIGVDIKGARIWKGAKYAKDHFPNVGFLRIRIEHIQHYFGIDEVDEIWITFPDPFLKEKKANRRLTSPAFLSRYKPFLKPNGIINLKTDDDHLYHYTLKVISKLPDTKLLETTDNIYAQGDVPEELKIHTYYEKRHLEAGKTIKYIRFTLCESY